MTPEEKAKAYDEALERAKSFQQKYGGDYAGYIFPELREREDEDERVRKHIVKYIDEQYPTHGCLKDEKARMLAYLEKHKEIPMPDSTELIEMWDQEKKMLKEKDFRDDAWRIAYNAFMDGFAKGTCVKFEKQKEQKKECGEKGMKGPQEIGDWRGDEGVCKKQKERMLKEAVEGRISAFGLHNAIIFKDQKWTDMLDKYKEGDKVRVIVLPKEEPNNG